MKRDTTEQEPEKAFDFEKHCGELGDAPRFRLLSDEKLERIHEASLEILENVGVKITTQPALKLLADAGCTVTDDDIVKIPRRLVKDAINSVPKRIVIYDREGEEALFLEGKNTYFGLGITAIYFRDPENGERRDATLGDIGLACRVADALPNLELIATPLVVRAMEKMPQGLGWDPVNRTCIGKDAAGNPVPVADPINDVENWLDVNVCTDPLDPTDF
ncbi:MAG: trimethylamine methyltransferase family protein [Dehalococcoidia bacterium]